MSSKPTEFQSHEIQVLIERIREEESRFDFDLRSSKREKIFLPVDIKSLDSYEESRGYTRNISAGGVCLVSERPVPIGEQKILRFLRHSAWTSEIIAECRWAKSHGHGYTMTGWEFIEAIFG